MPTLTHLFNELLLTHACLHLLNTSISTDNKLRGTWRNMELIKCKDIRIPRYTCEAVPGVLHEKFQKNPAILL